MSTNINNSFLEAYQEQCRNLAKTVVIKSGKSADCINNDLLLRFGEGAVDLESPETWKYYLNISGQYHVTDRRMYVTSLDTLETIEFSKENLAIHVATNEAYQYGTRYYYSLLNQYSDQDPVIMGILYPTDINTAINAPEGKILTYPATYVEPQEQTLIHDLELFIHDYLHRWNVPAFELTDSLYNVAYHIQLYLNILPKIYNLRLKRCHTPEAHSFHVREYLASHQYLHRYMPFLSQEQIMFLYRNIKYLVRHAGFTETFDTLLKEILTKRMIPVSEYSVRQLSSFDDKHYSIISARRKPLNDQFNIGEISYLPVERLYEKELSLAKDNKTFYKAEEENVTSLFQASDSSVMQTKDLESSMIDYTDAVPDPLTKVLMRQWVYMSTHGLYNVVVSFKDPKTGDLRSLYAKDAFIYYQYIFLKSVGYDIDKMPPYMNWKARNNPCPSSLDLLSVTDGRFPSDYKEIADAIVAGQPVLTPCHSVRAFHNQSVKIFDEAQKHWFTLSNIGDMNKRSSVNNMVLKLYHDEYVEFDLGFETIGEWLSELNLPVYDYELKQAEELMLNIFMASTGLFIDDTKLLKNVQKKLIDLMMELSSYTIQTIREINENPIIPISWAAIRPGNFEVVSEEERFQETNSFINGVSSTMDHDEKIQGLETNVLDIVEEETLQELSIPYERIITNSSSYDEDINNQFGSFKVDIMYDSNVMHLLPDPDLPGKEYFNLLTDEQKKRLKSIY